MADKVSTLYIKQQWSGIRCGDCPRWAGKAIAWRQGDESGYCCTGCALKRAGAAESVRVEYLKWTYKGKERNPDGTLREPDPAVEEPGANTTAPVCRAVRASDGAEAPRE